MALAMNPESEKIGTYTSLSKMRYNDRMKYFDEWILQICYFVGIDPAPEAPIRVMVMEFMIENYPTFSLDEIKHAFKMALSGKLDLTHDQMNHFNKFTAIWVTTIMNAYKRYLNKFLAEYKQKESRMIEENNSQISDQEAHKIMKEALIGLYQKHTNKEEWHDINGSCYDWAVRNGFIKQPDPFAYSMIMESAKEQILAETKGKRATNANPTLVQELETQINQIMQSAEKSPLVVVRTKKMLLSNYFSGLTQKGISIHRALNEMV